MISGVLALVVYIAGTVSGISVFDTKFGFIILLGACAIVYIASLFAFGSIKYIINNEDK